MVQAWGAMTPAHRLLLILLVALHARAAWAAPWRAWGADEGDGNGYPASQLDVGLEPLGHAGVTDVLVRRALPAPRLDAVLQPSRHRRGPRRATYQAEGGKRCLGSCEVLRQILEELQRGHETDQEAVKNKMFPERSSASLPVPAEETVAMQAISTPVLPRPGEDHQSSVYEFFRTDSGAVGERTTSVSNPQSTTRGRWPQNGRRHCMVATVVSLPLAILLCFVVICLRTKRKQRSPAASEAQLETGGCPLPPDGNQTGLPSGRESWTPGQQTPLRPGKPARPPSPRPPRPPSPSPEALLRRNQQSPPQTQTQPKRPPRPPSPTVWPYGKD